MSFDLSSDFIYNLLCEITTLKSFIFHPQTFKSDILPTQSPKPMAGNSSTKIKDLLYVLKVLY